VEPLAKKPLGELVEMFGPQLKLPEDFANPDRKRLFSPERTFWLFLSQVLCANGSCREALRKFLAWLAVEENAEASPLTGAYCKARARLPLRALEEVHEKLARTPAGEGEMWLGRTVKVVDGSSVSMPDTPENQERYPQPGAQKPGCGFPVMRIVALFSLGGGLLLELAKSALDVHERTLFHQLWDSLMAGDVVLGDTGFCSYADFYYLLQHGVDSVMRNHQARKKGLVEIERLDKGDRLVNWFKNKACPRWLSKEEWSGMPDTLTVREITVTVEVPGFRSTNLIIVTTLLDHKAYPKEAIIDLYRKRWAVELYLRDIKIALGMDILRCKTPDMVEKELWMHAIAYNLIRKLMNQAAQGHGRPLDRISFKGTVDTVRQWAPVMAGATQEGAYERNFSAMIRCIAKDPVPLRPDRTEPRAVKRRPKNHQRLTKPRKQFKETPHRGKKRAA
jgi:hypothetical protein